MTKKIYFDGFVFLHKAAITASSENVPDTSSSAHRQNIIILSNKTFQVLIFENIRIFVNIWNHGNNLQGLRVPNHCKHVGLV